jgi:osmotically-inducible protein OsmY
MTRAARDLEVRVQGGEAILVGRVPSAIRKTAMDLARRTDGIDKVRDQLVDTARA